MPIYKIGSKHYATNYKLVSLTAILWKSWNSSPATVSWPTLFDTISWTTYITALYHTYLCQRTCYVHNLIFLLDITQDVEVIVLNFTKAFVIMNHHLRLAKLEAFTVFPILCELMAAVLWERSLRIRVSDQLSSLLPVPNGVPQRSVFGLLHFIICLNDVLVFINSRCYMFADHVKVICSTSEVDILLEDPR